MWNGIVTGDADKTWKTDRLWHNGVHRRDDIIQCETLVYARDGDSAELESDCTDGTFRKSQMSIVSSWELLTI